MLLTRRTAIALSGWAACGKLLAARDDFWNTKDPADWTSDEVNRLLTESPWAKPAAVVAVAGSNDHRPWSEAPPVGLPPGGGIPRRRQEKTVRGGYQATVRWASAAPILAATKTPLPKGFEDRYVLAVVGLPLPDTSKLDDLKQFTSLRPKGRDLVQPGVVDGQGSSRTLLFGFSKELMTLGKGDREALFATKFNGFDVRAPFALGDMRYHGELAL